MSLTTAVYLDIFCGLTGCVLGVGLTADSLLHLTKRRTRIAITVQRGLALLICLSWMLFAAGLLCIVAGRV